MQKSIYSACLSNKEIDVAASVVPSRRPGKISGYFPFLLVLVLYFLNVFLYFISLSLSYLITLELLVRIDEILSVSFLNWT